MDWILNIENWDEINLKSLQEIQRLAEQRVQETVSSIQTGKERSFSIIKVLIPIVSILVAIAAEGSSEFSLTAGLAAVPLIYVIWRLVAVIFPNPTSVHGRAPEETSQDTFLVGKEYSEEQQFLALVIGEVEVLQQKITHNDDIIDTQTESIRIALHIITVTFVVTLAWVGLVAAL